MRTVGKLLGQWMSPLVEAGALKL